MTEPEFICRAKKNDSFCPTKNGVFFGGNYQDADISYCSINGFPEIFCKTPNGTWKANDSGVYYRNVFSGDRPFEYVFVDFNTRKKIVVCKNKEIFWAPLDKGGFLFAGYESDFGSSFSENGNFRSSRIIHSMLGKIAYFFTHNNKVYFSSNKNQVVEHDLLTGARKVVCDLMKEGDYNGHWTAFYGEVYQEQYEGGQYPVYYLGSTDKKIEQPIKITKRRGNNIYRFKATPSGLITSEGVTGEDSWNLMFYPKPI